MGQRGWQLGDWWLRSFPGGTVLDNMSSDPRHQQSTVEVGQLQMCCVPQWSVYMWVGMCVVFWLKAISPPCHQDCWMLLSTCRLRSEHLGDLSVLQDSGKISKKMESFLFLFFFVLCRLIDFFYYYPLLSFPFLSYLVFSDKANTPRLALREIVTLPDVDQSHPNGELILI